MDVIWLPACLVGDPITICSCGYPHVHMQYQLLAGLFVGKTAGLSNGDRAFFFSYARAMK